MASGCSDTTPERSSGGARGERTRRVAALNINTDLVRATRPPVATGCHSAQGLLVAAALLIRPGTAVTG